MSGYNYAAEKGVKRWSELVLGVMKDKEDQMEEMTVDELKGALSPHTHILKKSAAGELVYQSDTDRHWNVCESCGDHVDEQDHQCDENVYQHSTTNHWNACSVCGKMLNITPHIASDWIIDTPATTEKAGSRHKECTVCKYVMQTASIPKIEPDYSDELKNFEYTLDNSAKTITLTKYIGSNTDVIIRGKYLINGTSYSTRVRGTTNDTYRAASITGSDFFGSMAPLLTSVIFDTSAGDIEMVDYMSGLFYGCSKLTQLDMRNVKNSCKSYRLRVFFYCTNLTKVLVTSGKWSESATMDGSMFGFSGCSSFTYV